MTTAFPAPLRVLGLTGGIASGKSAVGDIIARRYPVLDADHVAREVVRPGTEGLARIVEAFGPEVLCGDGTLDRRGLRQIIAHDEAARLRLNGILHPLIRAEIERKLEALAAHHDAAFVSAALMLETGSYRRYDGVLLVTAPESVRLARLLARDGMDEVSARGLMAKQWADEKKRPFATVEVENAGDLADLERHTWDALDRLGLAVDRVQRTSRG